MYAGIGRDLVAEPCRHTCWLERQRDTGTRAHARTDTGTFVSPSSVADAARRRQTDAETHRLMGHADTQAQRRTSDA